MVRLFYALWPDEAVRARLAALLPLAQGRRTRPENLHVTLAFLGDQPEDLLPVLHDALDALPREDMLLTIDRLGAFARSRIAWAGMREEPEALHRLQRALAAQLAQRGIHWDDQGRFRPHVTLARGAEALPQHLSQRTSQHVFEPVLWRPGPPVLVQSTLHPDGARYRVLARGDAVS